MSVAASMTVPLPSVSTARCRKCSLSQLIELLVGRIGQLREPGPVSAAEQLAFELAELGVGVLQRVVA